MYALLMPSVSRVIRRSGFKYLFVAAVLSLSAPTYALENLKVNLSQEIECIDGPALERLFDGIQPDVFFKSDRRYQLKVELEDDPTNLHRYALKLSMQSQRASSETISSLNSSECPDAPVMIQVLSQELARVVNQRADERQDQLSLERLVRVALGGGGSILGFDETLWGALTLEHMWVLWNRLGLSLGGRVMLSQDAALDTGLVRTHELGGYFSPRIKISGQTMRDALWIGFPLHVGRLTASSSGFDETGRQNILQIQAGLSLRQDFSRHLSIGLESIYHVNTPVFFVENSLAEGRLSPLKIGVFLGYVF